MPRQDLTFESMAGLVGEELGLSSWITVDQAMIDAARSQARQTAVTGNAHAQRRPLAGQLGASERGVAVGAPLIVGRPRGTA